MPAEPARSPQAGTTWPLRLPNYHAQDPARLTYATPPAQVVSSSTAPKRSNRPHAAYLRPYTLSSFRKLFPLAVPWTAWTLWSTERWEREPTVAQDTTSR